MRASVVDLRYKMNEVLKALDRREKVTLIGQGKVKGTTTPVADHPFFNMAGGESKDRRATDECFKRVPLQRCLTRHFHLEPTRQLKYSLKIRIAIPDFRGKRQVKSPKIYLTKASSRPDQYRRLPHSLRTQSGWRLLGRFRLPSIYANRKTFTEIVMLSPQRCETRSIFFHQGRRFGA